MQDGSLHRKGLPLVIGQGGKKSIETLADALKVRISRNHRRKADRSYPGVEIQYEEAKRRASERTFHVFLIIGPKGRSYLCSEV